MWVSAPFLTFFKSLKCRLVLSIHSFLGKMNQNKLGIPLSLYSGFASHFKMFGKEDFQLQLFLLDWTLRNRWSLIISSVQFSCTVMSDSLRPQESQYAKPPCPSPTPRVYSNSCPSSQWCHPTISSSIVPFFSRPQSFPASGSFQMSQLFASVAKVLEFQLQHQPFQWTLRTDLL